MFSHLKKYAVYRDNITFVHITFYIQQQIHSIPWKRKYVSKPKIIISGN